MLNENSQIGKKYVDEKREANVQNCIYDWNSWVITDNVRCEAAGDQLSRLSARVSTSPAPALVQAWAFRSFLIKQMIYFDKV